MLKKALKVGQLIVNAHPSDVRLLFQRYGITAQPTGKSVFDAYLVYGKPFLVDLFNIGYQSMSNISSATGDTQLETDKLLAAAQAKIDAANAAKDKGSFFDGILNIFDKASDISSTVTDVFSSISALFGGKSIDTGSTNANADLQAEYIQAKLDAQAAAASNNTKTYLLIGAGLLVAVLVAIMFLKRK